METHILWNAFMYHERYSFFIANEKCSSAGDILDLMYIFSGRHLFTVILMATRIWMSMLDWMLMQLPVGHKTAIYWPYELIREKVRQKNWRW